MKSIKEIIAAGSEFWCIPERTLLSDDKHRHVVLARFSIMAACRAYGHSLESIGDAMRRDHGSVINGLKTITMNYFGEEWPNHCKFMVQATCNNKSSPEFLDELEKALRRTQRTIQALEDEVQELEALKIRATKIVNLREAA